MKWFNFDGDEHRKPVTDNCDEGIGRVGASCGRGNERRNKFNYALKIPPKDYGLETVFVLTSSATRPAQHFNFQVSIFSRFIALPSRASSSAIAGCHFRSLFVLEQAKSSNVNIRFLRMTQIARLKMKLDMNTHSKL